jgi:ribosomal-protein-alanine N-acetyltransferase
MNIILRQWQKEDAAALANIANNRNIWNNVRDRLPQPYTVSDAQQWIEFSKTNTIHKNFAVVCNNELVGSAGCIRKEDVYRKSIEIGYFIGERFWGKGIATQAVRLLVEYIWQNFDVVRIYAEVFEHNKASMKVLQKNDFYLECIHRKAAIKNNVILDDYIWVKLL